MARNGKPAARDSSLDTLRDETHFAQDWGECATQRPEEIRCFGLAGASLPLLEEREVIRTVEADFSAAASSTPQPLVSCDAREIIEQRAAEIRAIGPRPTLLCRRRKHTTRWERMKTTLRRWIDRAF